MKVLVFAGFRTHPRGGARDLLASADVSDEGDSWAEITEGLAGADTEAWGEAQAGLLKAGVAEKNLAGHLTAHCSRWAQVAEASSLILLARVPVHGPQEPLRIEPVGGAGDPHHRYLLFAGGLTPLGGLDDCLGSTDDLAEASGHAQGWFVEQRTTSRAMWAKEGHRPADVDALDRQLTYWAHVYDREADEIVGNWYDVKARG